MRRSWIACATLLAACGTSTGAVGTEIQTAPTPVPTVAGVGSLPGAIPATSLDIDPLVVITRPVTADGVEAPLIGSQVGGNRLLMIGDSIFASTESRYGGEMCAGLVPLGWAVEVAAEAGRFAEFGVEVVGRNVPEPDVGFDGEAVGETPATSQDSDGAAAPAGPDDWDAAAVFLGSNYGGEQDDFDAKMREILDRLAPRPTLLYTVTEYRTNYTEVSEVIDGLVADYSNVILIDWAEAASTAGVLRSDGLHPNDEGEQVLVDLTAAALGNAPAGEADCISSSFRDDSAIDAGNGSPNTGGSTTSGGGSSSTSSGGSSSGGSSSSDGSSSSSSGGSSSGGGGNSGGSSGTTTPATSPPATSPPVTSPPVTSPPVTSPPVTTAPDTSSDAGRSDTSTP
jgi:hypothetical protein